MVEENINNVDKIENIQTDNEENNDNKNVVDVSKILQEESFWYKTL